MGLLRVHIGAAWSGRRLTRLQLAILVFMLWTGIGVFQAVPEMLEHLQWPGFVAKVIDAWAWVLLTPAILLIERKISSVAPNIMRSFILFLLISIPFSIVHVYLSGILMYPLPQIWWNPLRDPGYLDAYFLGAWVTFLAIIGILQAFRFYNQFLAGQLHLERVERSLLESRLNALRLHLEPHFLFNALNTISSEVADNPGLARDMIGNLGTLLRKSLDCQDGAEITLEQELVLLDHYASIQKVRFGDRIEIEIDMEPGILAVMVPSMLLQPLLENAIRHGIEGRISGGRIVVSGSRAGDHLRLHVVDNGVGLPRQWSIETSTGHGLRVTLERLRALYPQSAEECLTIRRCEGEGTEVVVCIPLHGARTEGHEAIA
jgi:two-component system LytT family sensor kinase